MRAWIDFPMTFAEATAIKVASDALGLHTAYDRVPGSGPITRMEVEEADLPRWIKHNWNYRDQLRSMGMPWRKATLMVQVLLGELKKVEERSRISASDAYLKAGR